ncbi:MAG: pyrroline-5-carboxylate reductase [Prevotellaceae bacterium]|jgi:pyrroline-5-carboxylate reductase|nr:pyrroline-5-carboxylate reductase [Prevotellaceae bacterium]
MNAKITIIGAGNMGGSIARGLAKGGIIAPADMVVTDPSEEKLTALKLEFPDMRISHNNSEAVEKADYVLLAVKPWLVKPVLGELTLHARQVIISVAAGISFEELAHYLPDPQMTLFRLIPNTAISTMQSMTLIASRNASYNQEQFMLRLFNTMGLAMLIPEEKAAACTALTSCGIAYVLKDIQAAMQAGIEMGIYPQEAMRMVAQSVKGAAELILTGDTHPALEIDKVCTPGGITIKGLNQLEQEGFTAAIIQAMKASR